MSTTTDKKITADWLVNFEREVLGKYNGDASVIIAELDKHRDTLFTGAMIDSLHDDKPRIWQALHSRLNELKNNYEVTSCFESDNALSKHIKDFTKSKKKAGKISNYICGVKRGDVNDAIAGLVIGYCVNTPVILVLDKWRNHEPWKVKYGNHTFKEAIEIPESAVDCDGEQLILLTLVPEKPVYLPIYQPLDHFKVQNDNLSRHRPGVILSVAEDGGMNEPQMYQPKPDEAHSSTSLPREFAIKFDFNGSLLGLTDKTGRPVFDGNNISRWNEAAMRFFDQIFNLTRLDPVKFDQLIQYIIAPNNKISAETKDLLKQFKSPLSVLQYHYPFWALLNVRRRLENYNKERQHLITEVNRSLQNREIPAPHPVHTLLLFMLICDKVDKETTNRKIAIEVLHDYIKPLVVKHYLEELIPEEKKLTDGSSRDKSPLLLTYLDLILVQDGSSSLQEDLLRGWFARQLGNNTFQNIRDLYNADSQTSHTLKGLLDEVSGDLGICLEQNNYSLSELKGCLHDHSFDDVKECAHAVSLARLWFSSSIDESPSTSGNFTKITDHGWLLGSYSTKAA
jgi:hypothetical protein